LRFIVDECTGDGVAKWLKMSGYEAYSVYTENKGAEDDWILEKAIKENYIVITNDKDFGMLVFKKGKGHRGVIFLRLQRESTENKIETIKKVLEQCREKLPYSFIVASEDFVRISKKSITI
jgi:predicted nuclease of predicted toxin-antitoxin system